MTELVTAVTPIEAELLPAPYPAPGGPTVRYVGSCPVCPWEGPGRASNLTALADYDRHADTAGHILASLAPARLDDEEDATD